MFLLLFFCLSFPLSLLTLCLDFYLSPLALFFFCFFSLSLSLLSLLICPPILAPQLFADGRAHLPHSPNSATREVCRKSCARIVWRLTAVHRVASSLGTTTLKFKDNQIHQPYIHKSFWESEVFLLSAGAALGLLAASVFFPFLSSDLFVRLGNWQLRCAKPVCLWFTKDCQLGPQWAVQIDWFHWSWTLAMIYGQQMTALTNLVISPLTYHPLSILTTSILFYIPLFRALVSSLHVHLWMASSQYRIAKSGPCVNLLKFLPQPFLCRFVNVFNLPSHLEFREAYASLLMKQFWEWNALLNRVSDQRQIWTSGPHCLVDCIFPPLLIAADCKHGNRGALSQEEFIDGLMRMTPAPASKRELLEVQHDLHRMWMLGLCW